MRKEKLIVLTFAGRKMYMEILFPYIEKYKHHINEYHIYVATNNEDDIKFIEDFYNRNKDFVKLFYFNQDGKPVDKVMVWNQAYKNSMEDAIYLKIDDDIVYLDESLFTTFIDYRINNPYHPIVYPVIINNVISNWYLQEYVKLCLPIYSHSVPKWVDAKKRFNQKLLTVQRDKNFRIGHVASDDEVLCPVIWGNKSVCESIHRDFIKKLENNDLESLKIPNVVFQFNEPMSIQCISWFGPKLKEYTENFGDVGIEDEPWLSVYLPMWEHIPNAMCGEVFVSHFSYYRQVELGILNTDLLSKYKAIMEQSI